ncbi:endonuclease III [candidate division WWE3 bacterium RIFOXYB1_FULL_43_24]|uniref:Endonuclease III n=2 Tax=Katanobacteria TaxID=422282 RepID=A0A0G0YJQ5_UNCKA|nr:MAG: Endonuclease III (DNA-(Apurinic or apyrimidinic site) lyase) [candidate division WWE3 bacterium GW2011_GWA1_42_12]KKS36940.1 MAG: Endonuclease III (DNA-(Apurinic or apyrimidinic site) lyase) [candidate division WWE3 bacterium GW2011_GWF1_42_14]KKS39899.1 MAG: Endonuclease III (DNA-(Apurinic or apyrimidinic site) lyase) [candidate division WWE3 bacterium GW2011_GWE1_42_16]KKS65958.1 MAG: Endonuclease III (DNA-(Apurinic or apyrimidinic site) lyase) [candidate division WWE3 bacterium GW2011
MYKKEKADRAEKVALLLQKENPAPKTELTHVNEYQLAIAVMLSAQTTDKKVNQVTPALFAKYPDWEALASADTDEVAGLIRQVNFHKGKAQRIVAAARTVLSLYDGMLPHDMLQLMKLPGVARKSANVIMQELWGIAEGIVVDTHVSRISQRLGLTSQKDPKKIEEDLMSLLPKKYWRNFSGSAVLHGRYVCTARNPKCGECVLNGICPSAHKI